MSDQTESPPALTPGADFLILQVAEGCRRETKAEQLHLGHLLLAALQRHGAMVELLVPGLAVAALAEKVKADLEGGLLGPPVEPGELVCRALERGEARGQLPAAERDVVAAILSAAGLLEDGFRPLRPGQRPTPLLDALGRDLTHAAASGALEAAHGRGPEVDLAVESLLRRHRRCVAVVGPAGASRASILEGLARRAAEDALPEPLLGMRVVALQPSSLYAGVDDQAAFDRRMRALVAEASQPGIVLALEEGAPFLAGSGAGNALAAALRPALTAGALTCLAGLTEGEHRSCVEGDSSLERRFQAVRVRPLSRQEAREVLAAALPDLSERLRVTASEERLGQIVDLAVEYLGARPLPDSALDLLEQCLSHAAARGAAEVTAAQAQLVARRAGGAPEISDELLGGLERRLIAEELLAPPSARALAAHLSASLREADLRAERPDAVLLLLGAAAARSRPLATALAEGVFGGAERLVAIDLAPMVTPQDVALLVGVPPGVQGPSDGLALHRLLEAPWSVLLLENVDACDESIRALLARALAEGFLDDARGRRVPLDEALVVVTSASIPSDAGGGRPLGFAPAAARPAADPTPHEVAGAAVGAALAAQCDLVVTGPGDAARGHAWLREEFLGQVGRRYQARGLDMDFDESLVDWLAAQGRAGAGRREWERLLDAHLAPALLPHLRAEAPARTRLRVKHTATGLVVEQEERDT